MPVREWSWCVLASRNENEKGFIDAQWRRGQGAILDVWVRDRIARNCRLGDWRAGKGGLPQASVSPCAGGQRRNRVQQMGAACWPALQRSISARDTGGCRRYSRGYSGRGGLAEIVASAGAGMSLSCQLPSMNNSVDWRAPRARAAAAPASPSWPQPADGARRANQVAATTNTIGRRLALPRGNARPAASSCTGPRTN